MAPSVKINRSQFKLKTLFLFVFLFPQIGFAIDISVSSRLEHSNNILLDQNYFSDIMLSNIVRVEGEHQNSWSQTEVEYQAEVINYDKGYLSDTTLWEGYLSNQLELSGQRLYWHNLLLSDVGIIDPAAPQTSDNLEVADYMQIGPELSFQPSRVDDVMLQARVGRTNMSVSRTDNDRFWASLLWRHELSPLTSVGLDITEHRVQYETPVNIYLHHLGGNWNVESHGAFAELKVYYSVAEADEHGINDAEGVFISLSLSKRFNHSQVALNCGNRLQDSNAPNIELSHNAGTDVSLWRGLNNTEAIDIIVYTHCYAAYNYQISPVTELAVLAAYEEEDYQSLDNDENITSGGFEWVRQLPRSTAISFRYRYSDIRYDFQLQSKRHDIEQESEVSYFVRRNELIGWNVGAMYQKRSSNVQATYDEIRFYVELNLTF